MFHVLFAEGEGGAGGAGGGFFGNPMSMFFIIGLMILFWIVVVLPAGRRQRKEQEVMLATLKRGAKIVTSSGILGTVITAKDGEAEITIRSEDAKLRILRSTVLKVLGSDEAEANKTS